MQEVTYREIPFGWNKHCPLLAVTTTTTPTEPDETATSIMEVRDVNGCVIVRLIYNPAENGGNYVIEPINALVKRDPA